MINYVIVIHEYAKNKSLLSSDRGLLLHGESLWTTGNPSLAGQPLRKTKETLPAQRLLYHLDKNNAQEVKLTFDVISGQPATSFQSLYI